MEMYQLIIRYGRFKKTSITLQRVIKNKIEWFNSDPNLILTTYKLINQGLNTFNHQYYNTHQKLILSNMVTKNDIYNNYSYTSCVNWKIEKRSDTPLKKLEFYIDNPEKGLKKTDFNIITNKDEIDDLYNNIRDHYNSDLTDDMYNNIDHNNVDQKQKNNDDLYTLADNKLQLSSDLEDLYWNSTKSHEGELSITYDNKVGNKTLFTRTFYTLYVKPNQEGNSHLTYRLDKDQIVFTENYQKVHVPEDIDHMPINDEDQYTQEAKKVIQSSLLMPLQ